MRQYFIFFRLKQCPGRLIQFPPQLYPVTDCCASTFERPPFTEEPGQIRAPRTVPVFAVKLDCLASYVDQLRILAKELPGGVESCPGTTCFHECREPLKVDFESSKQYDSSNLEKTKEGIAVYASEWRSLRGVMVESWV